MTQEFLTFVLTKNSCTRRSEDEVVVLFGCPVVVLCHDQRRESVLPSPRLWLWMRGHLLCSGSFVLRASPELLRSGAHLLRSGSGS